MSILNWFQIRSNDQYRGASNNNYLPWSRGKVNNSVYYFIYSGKDGCKFIIQSDITSEPYRCDYRICSPFCPFVKKGFSWGRKGAACFSGTGWGGGTNARSIKEIKFLVDEPSYCYSSLPLYPLKWPFRCIRNIKETKFMGYEPK